MMNMATLEAALQELPLYEYFEFTSDELTFSDRIRWICEHECPMYGKSWACPPGVGTVGQCRSRCLGYKKGLCVSTIVEVADISDIDETLATRPDHETVTEQVAALMREHGAKETYILSTEACAVCERCAILDGKPCRAFYIIWIYWGNLDYSVFLYRLAVKFRKVFDGYDKKQGGQIA